MWNMDYIQSLPSWLKIVIVMAGITIVVIGLLIAPEMEDENNKPLDEKSKS